MNQLKTVVMRKQNSVNNMSIPSNKIELLEAFEVSYKKLRHELEEVPIARVYKKELVGHVKNSKMSMHNLVSYLLGWGELLLAWCEADEVDLEATGYKWNELGLLAQKFYENYESVPFDTLLTRFDEVTEEIKAIVQSSSNQQLYTRNWYKKYSKGRMIQLNTVSPYKNACTRIRTWKRNSEMSEKEDQSIYCNAKTDFTK